MITVERRVGNATEMITFENMTDYMMFLVLTGEADIQSVLNIMAIT